MVSIWKHEISLNTTADYVDLGQDDSRRGGNMLSDAKYTLNVNPARYPDTLDMGINERWQSMRFLGFGLSTMKAIVAKN